MSETTSKPESPDAALEAEGDDDDDDALAAALFGDDDNDADNDDATETEAIADGKHLLALKRGLLEPQHDDLSVPGLAYRRTQRAKC